MTTFLIPFLVFAAVILIMLLAYWVWGKFFDRLNNATKKRLQEIQNTIQGVTQSQIKVQKNIRQDSELEAWLRLHFAAFERLENLIQRARIPLTPVRLMGIILALFTVVVVFGLLRHTSPLLLVLLAVAIASTPLLWVQRKARKRRRAFDDKFPEALDYISRSLRAGQSLTSALGMVGKEFPDPIGTEFKTVADAMAFGISFKDALGELADRVESSDLTFFVIALMIQHEAGGNLTELFDGLAKTIRERIKLRGKVRTLSAEGRASAWVLSSLPFLLASVLMFINSEYISTLWRTPDGQNLILTGGVLMALGFFTINRMIKIKV
jgi:tight adherence protein B